MNGDHHQTEVHQNGTSSDNHVVPSDNHIHSVIIAHQDDSAVQQPNPVAEAIRQNPPAENHVEQTIEANQPDEEVVNHVELAVTKNVNVPNPVAEAIRLNQPPHHEHTHHQQVCLFMLNGFCCFVFPSSSSMDCINTGACLYFCNVSEYVVSDHLMLVSMAQTQTIVYDTCLTDY